MAEEKEIIIEKCIVELEKNLSKIDDYLQIQAKQHGEEQESFVKLFKLIEQAFFQIKDYLEQNRKIVSGLLTLFKGLYASKELFEKLLIVIFILILQGQINAIASVFVNFLIKFWNGLSENWQIAIFGALIVVLTTAYQVHRSSNKIGNTSNK